MGCKLQEDGAVTTFMVHLELGRPNTKLLRIAADLASRFNADVVGIAACQPLRILYGDSYISGDVIEQDRDEIAKEANDAEDEFRAVLRGRGRNLEWRSTVTFAPLADYLADQARCADLVITGVDHSGSIFDSSRHVDIGDLVMQLGRPALIVPTNAEKLSFKRMLIGWKDSRESRRAVLDALPLLKQADHVAICEIVPGEETVAAQARLADVVGWLRRDGIAAEPVVALAMENDAAQLDAIANDQAADVIIAGAYGHSRLREWALGGVTKELLLRAGRCSFVSH
jgi:nucleotide-binding universal stress UspA family protein